MLSVFRKSLRTNSVAKMERGNAYRLYSKWAATLRTFLEKADFSFGKVNQLLDCAEQLGCTSLYVETRHPDAL
jgi:hypothetical protein